MKGPSQSQTHMSAGSSKPMSARSTSRTTTREISRRIFPVRSQRISTTRLILDRLRLEQRFSGRRIPLCRYSFAWYPGPQSPTPDGVRYDVMSSGIIQPDEFPALSDTRFLFSFGPFNIDPISTPGTEPLRIAIAVVSGYDRRIDHRIVFRTMRRAPRIFT